MKPINFFAVLLFWETVFCNHCRLSNVTIALEKEECGFCISVNATWCSGYCLTKDLVDQSLAMRYAQNICTFKAIVYETIKIPGCAGQAESFYSYPVATGCHCGTCNSDITDCTRRGLDPDYCSYDQYEISE